MPGIECDPGLFHGNEYSIPDSIFGKKFKKIHSKHQRHYIIGAIGDNYAGFRNNGYFYIK